VSKRATFCLLLAACAAEVDPPPSPATEAPAPPPDLPSRPVAGTAGTLLAWSFEPASADCNGWPVEGALAIRASPPHSGTYSCKVCATGDVPAIRLRRTIGAAPAGSYALTAWVRKRAATAAPERATARIEAGDRVASAPVVTVREEWDKLEATLELGADVSDLRVVIGADVTEADRCLFVDDVTVSRR